MSLTSPAATRDSRPRTSSRSNQGRFKKPRGKRSGAFLFPPLFSPGKQPNSFRRRRPRQDITIFRGGPCYDKSTFSIEGGSNGEESCQEAGQEEKKKVDPRARKRLFLWLPNKPGRKRTGFFLSAGDRPKKRRRLEAALRRGFSWTRQSSPWLPPRPNRSSGGSSSARCASP